MSSSTAMTIFDIDGRKVTAAIKGAPDFGLFRLAHLNHREFLRRRQRLVQHHPGHRVDAENVFQMIEIERFVGHFLDHARLRRRHLADDRAENRLFAPRDRGDFHVGIVFLRIDVPVGFAERRFRLEDSVETKPSMMISASAGTMSGTVLALTTRIGAFDKTAGDGKLIDVVGKFCRAGNRRHPADAQRRGHLFLARCGIFPNARRCPAPVPAKDYSRPGLGALIIAR